MSEHHLSDKDQQEYDRIFNEWLEKVKEIPPYEDRHPDGVYVLDGGYNGPYTELEKIYRPQLDEILARGGKAKMKKFSDLIEKSAGEHTRSDDVLKGRFQIKKSDDEKMLAFGWASVAVRVDGEVVVDWQKDIIEPAELENAAYEFVRLYREGGEMHERGGAAVLIESVVFTEEKMQAIGIPAGTLPVGWWIGFKVTDPDVWEKVKDGTYQMFSIEGTAERVEADEGTV